MSTHTNTLEQWHEALTKALQDDAIDAVPGILVRMTRDGWGEHAEAARRLLTPPPSLGALAGHDEEAARQLRIIREAYRLGGLDVLRAVSGDLARMASRGALALLLVEAVLALQEHGPGARRAAEQAAFDRAEAADTAEEIHQGGNR
jgi:hypothetical protein